MMNRLSRPSAGQDPRNVQNNHPNVPHQAVADPVGTTSTLSIRESTKSPYIRDGHNPATNPMSGPVSTEDGHRSALGLTKFTMGLLQTELKQYVTNYAAVLGRYPSLKEFKHYAVGHALLARKRRLLDDTPGPQRTSQQDAALEALAWVAKASTGDIYQKLGQPVQRAPKAPPPPTSPPQQFPEYTGPITAPADIVIPGWFRARMRRGTMRQLLNLSEPGYEEFRGAANGHADRQLLPVRIQNWGDGAKNRFYEALIAIDGMPLDMREKLGKGMHEGNKEQWWALKVLGEHLMCDRMRRHANDAVIQQRVRERFPAEELRSVEEPGLAAETVERRYGPGGIIYTMIGGKRVIDLMHLPDEDDPANPGPAVSAVLTPSTGHQNESTHGPQHGNSASTRTLDPTPTRAPVASMQTIPALPFPEHTIPTSVPAGNGLAETVPTCREVQEAVFYAMARHSVERTFAQYPQLRRELWERYMRMRMEGRLSEQEARALLLGIVRGALRG